MKAEKSSIIKIVVLLFFLAISVQTAYADVCEATNGKVTIDGILQPSLVNCPLQVVIQDSRSQSTVHVINGQPAPTQTPVVVTFVVTGTPTPAPTVRHIYRPTIVPRFILTPTQEPTATPSATSTPLRKEPQTRSRKQPSPTFFENIMTFLKTILHAFLRL